MSPWPSRLRGPNCAGAAAGLLQAWMGSGWSTESGPKPHVHDHERTMAWAYSPHPRSLVPPLLLPPPSLLASPNRTSWTTTPPILAFLTPTDAQTPRPSSPSSHFRRRTSSARCPCPSRPLRVRLPLRRDRLRRARLHRALRRARVARGQAGPVPVPLPVLPLPRLLRLDQRLGPNQPPPPTFPSQTSRRGPRRGHRCSLRGARRSRRRARLSSTCSRGRGVSREFLIDFNPTPSLVARRHESIPCTFTFHTSAPWSHALYSHHAG